MSNHLKVSVAEALTVEITNAKFRDGLSHRGSGSKRLFHASEQNLMLKLFMAATYSGGTSASEIGKNFPRNGRGRPI